MVITSRTAGQVFVGDDVGTIPSAFSQLPDTANVPPLADTRLLLVHAYYVSSDSSEGVGFPIPATQDPDYRPRSY